MTRTWATLVSFRRVGVLILASGLFAAGAAAGAAKTKASAQVPEDALFICTHTKISEWECPDTSYAGASARVAPSTTTLETKAAQKSTPLAKGQVTSLKLVVGITGAKSVTRTFSPNVDAIFLTKGSTRNFLVRYYRDTGATAKQQKLEARLNARYP